MAVQDQLRTEGGIAAHADRHMTPFAIHDVKVAMVDERPVLAVADFCNLPSGIAFDLPDRRRALDPWPPRVCVLGMRSMSPCNRSRRRSYVIRPGESWL